MHEFMYFISRQGVCYPIRFGVDPLELEVKRESALKVVKYFDCEGQGWFVRLVSLDCFDHVVVVTPGKETFARDKLGAHHTQGVYPQDDGEGFEVHDREPGYFFVGKLEELVSMAEYRDSTSCQFLQRSTGAGEKRE